MTTGEVMFYGGIAGSAIFGILLIVSWCVLEKKKRDLRKRIEEEY